VAAADARIEQPQLAQLVVIDAQRAGDVVELVAEGDLDCRVSVRRVEASGIITIVAGGNPYPNGSDDDIGDGGPALAASFFRIKDIAFAPDGTMYVADDVGVRRITPDGVIDTFAGGRGNLSLEYRDGAPATEVPLIPLGLAVTAVGELLITDRGWDICTGDYDCGRIVGVAGGKVTTVAGRGEPADGIGEGSPPKDIAVDAFEIALQGNDIFLADHACDLKGSCGRIRRFNAGFSSVGIGTTLVPSENGDEIYTFDGAQHVETRDALTGAIRYAFGYDGDGLLVGITDAYNNVTQIERAPSGLATAIVGPYGHRTTLGYDVNGYLATITNPAGETVEASYTADGLMTELIDAAGGAYAFDYDSGGRLVREEDPLGGVKLLSRDVADGEVKITLTTGVGAVSTYRTETSASGSTSTATDATGAVTVATTSPGGALVVAPDGTRYETSHAPDPRWSGKLSLPSTIRVTLPGGDAWAQTIEREVAFAVPGDPLSLTSLTTITTVRGKTTTVHYDAASRTATTTSPAGRQTISVFDQHGRLVSITHADGLHPITYAYDARGRLAQMSQGPQSVTYAYDTPGRVASIEDALGNFTTFEYDDADRETARVLPGGVRYEFSYDANGNRASVTMPNGQVHQLGYNAINLRATYTPPGSDPFTRAYNGDRALTSATLPSGAQVGYQYADGDQLVARVGPETTAEFDYDALSGQLTGMDWSSDNGLSTQVGFGFDGYRATATNFGPSADYAFDFDLDFNFSGSTLSYGGDQSQLFIHRDSDGLPTQIGDFYVLRDGPGGAPSTISDSVAAVTRDYDAFGRTTSKQLTIGGNLAYRVELDYDQGGRIAGRREQAGAGSVSQTFQLDNLGQLTSVSDDGGVIETYQYDGNGNRTSANGTACDLRRAGPPDDARLDAVHSSTSTASSRPRGSDAFDYAATGELLSATIGGATVNYGYDSLGRRTSRQSSAGTEHYFHGNPAASFQVTAYADESGTLTELIYDELDHLISLERNGQTYYVATDQLGTPRLVVDQTGATVVARTYDAFGRKLTDSDPAFDLPIGFAGGIEDPLTGLVRFGFRDFDPSAGRWTARDPVLYAGGQGNLYAYAGNNPVLYSDPYGLAVCIGGSFYLGLGLGGSCVSAAAACRPASKPA
jgi:RHS repeat-associated protein